LKELTEADYDDDYDDDGVEDPEANNTMGAKLAGTKDTKKTAKSKDALTQSIESLAFKSGFSLVSKLIHSRSHLSK
jgi:hypothetical protein